MTLASVPSIAPRFRLRNPDVSDGARIWQLVRSIGVLEPNTCYAYLLLSSHFADTCVVAEDGERLVGFVAGYCPPTKPGVIFVWQIGVSHEARGVGLGKSLLHHVVDLPVCESVTFLEATVAASNQASLNLFTSFAKERGVPCEFARGFAAADFGPFEHETEDLLSIGPLRST